ncbi:hypothetical protein LINGRAHAP2_LOCUS6644 [Linum grandiflorum]
MITHMENSKVGQFVSLNTLLLFWVLLYALCSEMVGSYAIKNKGSNIDPKTILKTIESKNGKLIDCVDIYKQPSLQDPLLKNHTLQMKPNLMKGKNSSHYKDSNSIDMFISWYKNGKHCPEGTIPIVRSAVSPPFNKTLPMLRPDMIGSDGLEREYCILATETDIGDGTEYHGASAEFSIWKPFTSEGEHSIAQIWLSAGSDQDVNTIEAGWIVKGWASDYEPSLFIYWTRDYYSTTGCYDLQCPGFVQTNHIIALGSHLAPSTYMGEQTFLSIDVHMDRDTCNWWLTVHGQNLGYWPSAIFTAMVSSAKTIHWGGEILNRKSGGFHTLTHMGSGHFPNRGRGRAAIVKNVRMVDDNWDTVDAEDGIDTFATRRECYDIEFQPYDPDDKVHFYYGGPGQTEACRH